MKIGASVWYKAPRRKRKLAVVAGLAPENGRSGHKRLDLVLNNREVEDVPHQVDADGGPYWVAVRE